MDKVRDVKSYEAENIPEHIMQEITNLQSAIIEAIKPLVVVHQTNIVISALSRVNAIFIALLTNEDQMADSANIFADTLIKNIEYFAAQAKKHRESIEN
jgi:hypothetical protein